MLRSRAPIWLGEKAASDANVFQATEAILNHLSWQRVSGVKERLTVDEINGLANFPGNGWEHIWLLLSRPWFFRLWVLQEAVKAGDLVFL
jgi:5-methylcytosine-specific restriction endonuclease McrBC GTP-binding regulatory subunit McrB